MIDYSKELREQVYELEKLLMKAKKQKKTFEGITEGSIRVCASKGKPQYYFKEKGAVREKYVHAKDREFVKKVMQRDYNKKAFRMLDNMHKEMEKFLARYDIGSFYKLYDELCEGRKSLIVPLDLSDEKYIENWMVKYPGGQNPFPEKGQYETERGELVRSKSEKIIADLLFKMKVPYQYEPQVILDEHKFSYPDFACLNVRKRKTFFWEHLGLLNMNDYAAKNLAKLETYEKNGILLGDALIISTESTDNPLDIMLIRKKIETFLW